ncbi:hypothetical protein DM01DRAFT_1331201 [Hesseltinella vesiculosa]|uniref:Sister chromatid cohesion protein DCC1 n=1 Tax=Hesseltinella vesiculosa TaxID=101127 RepID=A0A1X2GYG1_9FUNG|nr:hypothetical protein DM01DRAFT_1331201 [Hesseltinella vesiculosa]
MLGLQYSSGFQKGKHFLIQLDHNDLVQELEQGSSVTIKGLPDDEAVLCTDTATYSIRQVNTSNSLLLCQPGSDTWQVHDDLGFTIELTPCPARTQRLDILLSSTLYTGPENEQAFQSLPRPTFTEAASTPRLYQWHDLVSVVQASNAQLQAALDDLNAFVLDGYYRKIETGYVHRLLDSMATNATIHGVSLRAATLDQLFDCLDQDFDTVPTPVRLAFLKTFVMDIDSSTLSLDPLKVTRFLGLTLLEGERGKEWLLDDFMGTWEQLTQLIMDERPDLATLRGLFYTTQRQVLQQPQVYITYLPRHELPSDPAERFTRLFAVKAQWSQEDMFPFLDDLARDAKQRDAFLLKFTRTQKLAGSVVYGSRIK